MTTVTHPTTPVRPQRTSGATHAAVGGAGKRPSYAPQVLVALPDVRSARPVPVAEHTAAVAPAVGIDVPPADKASRSKTHRVDSASAPHMARQAGRDTRRWRVRRRLRVDQLETRLRPALSTVGNWARQRMTRATVVEILQGRAIWILAFAALLIDVAAVVMLSAPAPAAKVDELPPLPMIPTLQGPTLAPTAPSAVPPPKRNETLFPNQSPTLGNPGEALPWESWTPQRPMMPPASNESAANRSGQLFDPTPLELPRYNTPHLPLTTAPQFAEQAETQPARARLLGVIRKSTPEVAHERPRPSLY